MQNHVRNHAFLNVTDSKARAAILGAIANHYGITPEAAKAEVTGEGCEHLLEYLTGSIRAATHLLMKRHGLAGF